MTLPLSPASGIAASLPPTERRPCPVPRRLQRCEVEPPPQPPEPPRPRLSPRRARALLFGLLVGVAAAGATAEPRRGR